MAQDVVIKSSPHGINLVMNPEIPFQQLKKEVLSKFAESDKFFKNAKIALSFTGRELSQQEQEEILDIIANHTSIHVICVVDPVESHDEYYKQRIEEYEAKMANATGEFYRGTLRSGQTVECETSLIVLGDVNPGAKIMARGNIVVLGSLRGNAYAGLDGNTSAFVAALDMDPMQIRIGDVIGRSADRGPLSAIINRKKQLEPQIAYVVGEAIMIEPITKGLFN